MTSPCWPAQVSGYVSLFRKNGRMIESVITPPPPTYPGCFSVSSSLYYQRMATRDETRLDPETLLRSLKRAEEKEGKGRLKIFFGMCAGVGKTYEMLQAGQEAKKKGIDIVIGYVETHGRTETEALVGGLTIIPRKRTEYRGVSLEEMDLDAILARTPRLVLVDELAHTNAPGSRHTKRYLDVMELLDNGIDVYSTLNVQHLESRADTVAQITGAIVRETIPDSVFERADELEVIDLPPDELLKRLAEGKVYAAERSQRAVQNFFRLGNLTALRASGDHGSPAIGWSWDLRRARGLCSSSAGRVASRSQCRRIGSQRSSSDRNRSPTPKRISWRKILRLPVSWARRLSQPPMKMLEQRCFVWRGNRTRHKSLWAGAPKNGFGRRVLSTDCSN